MFYQIPNAPAVEKMNIIVAANWAKNLLRAWILHPKCLARLAKPCEWQGLITAGESVISTDGIKNAFSPKKDSSVRVYNAPKREKTATIPANEAMAQLHSFSVKKG